MVAYLYVWCNCGAILVHFTAVTFFGGNFEGLRIVQDVCFWRLFVGLSFILIPILKRKTTLNNQKKIIFLQ